MPHECSRVSSYKEGQSRISLELEKPVSYASNELVPATKLKKIQFFFKEILICYLGGEKYGFV